MSPNNYLWLIWRYKTDPCKILREIFACVLDKSKMIFADIIADLETFGCVLHKSKMIFLHKIADLETFGCVLHKSKTIFVDIITDFRPIILSTCSYHSMTFN